MMTQDEFNKFRALVYNHTHIFCADTQKSVFERKIHARLIGLGFSSFEEYYQFITAGEAGVAELTRLIEVIAVHETSFFRISGHFAGLESRVFPEFIRQIGDQQETPPIRIWSAGCSTGEEPYSIVITYFKTLEQLGVPLSKTPTLKILATDICPSVLEKAQSGRYSQAKMKKIPQSILDKYFEYRNNQYYVIDQVKQPVTYAEFNLIKIESPPEPEFDIIFCRNIMIYFDRPAQEKLLKALIHLLPVGGYLFLGDAESIHTFTESASKLEFIESDNAIIYQKHGGDPNA